MSHAQGESSQLSNGSGNPVLVHEDDDLLHLNKHTLWSYHMFHNAHRRTGMTWSDIWNPGNFETPERNLIRRNDLCCEG